MHPQPVRTTDRPPIPESRSMNEMQTTTMYLPECAPALIAETQRAILDSRIVDGLVDTTDTEESHAACMRRKMGSLLPDRNHGEGVLWLRVSYGWTVEELQQIRSVLRDVALLLRSQVKGVVLSGTAETLRRDADQVDRLIAQWTP
jgi:hypothetical protein